MLFVLERCVPMTAWNDIWNVLLQSVCSLAVLFILTKLMGNRQMSQLTMFDYIAGISIGSIAANMASQADPDLWQCLIGMAVYALCTLGINLLNDHSQKARQIILGSPVVLYDRGKLYYDNMKKTKLDLTELLALCRSAGYFDLSELQMILLEVNGKLSILPNACSRPLTPADMQLSPQQERPVVAVVMDGVVYSKRLHAIGLDERWLDKELEIQGYRDYQDILLATVDPSNVLAVFERDEYHKSKDYYA